MDLKELLAQRETAERLIQALDAIVVNIADQRANLAAWCLDLDSQILELVMS